MNKQIIQEAAEWFVEFNSDTPDAETRKQFDSWLRASPEHVRAFLEIVPIWEDGARLPLDPGVTPEQLIERARHANNVIPLQAAEPQKHTPGELGSEGRSNARKVVRGLMAASFVVALVGVMLIWRFREVSYPTYTTGVGELRSLMLPDSSTVELNTHSKIRVRYSSDERAIDLLEGQALFQVAKNTARPFVVYSGEARARAVGTRFDVYKKTLGTVITVVEGRVAVYSGSGTQAVSADAVKGGHPAAAQSHDDAARTALDIPGSILLNAGDQFTVGSSAEQKIEHPNLSGATAWTQRQLVFDSTPLKEVVEEFNRYNARRLSIDAAELGNLHISGIFSSTDPSSFIRFLREQPGITVAESAHEIHVSQN